MNAWLASMQERWQAWWPELEPREQRLMIAGVALVVLALVWWIAVAPALRVLSAAPEAHAQLDAQLQQMTSLQARARELQSQPRANRDDATRALETSVRQGLGANAQLQPAPSGEGMMVAMRAVPAESLAQWLGQARSNARAVPRELHLTRTPGGGQPGAAAPSSAASKAADAPAVRWDGTMIMGLPAR